METKKMVDNIHNITMNKSIETLNQNKCSFERFVSEHIVSGSDLDNLIQYLLRWQMDFLSGQTFDLPEKMFPHFQNDFFAGLSYLAQMCSGVTGVVENPVVSWKKFDDAFQLTPGHKDENDSFPEVSLCGSTGGEGTNPVELLNLIVWARENSRLYLSSYKKTIQKFIALHAVEENYPEVFAEHPTIFFPHAQT